MRRAFLLILTTMSALSAFAWNYDSQTTSKQEVVQMRVGADFTKHWDCGVKLSIAEEVRFDLMYQLADSNFGPGFNKFYTTIALSYAPIEYVKFDAGYTMRILGRRLTADYNEWLRHRVFFSVTGSYRFNVVKLYLRERALCEIRTDSVNLKEKNQYDWLLRSRVGAEFHILSKPNVKPYLWFELENTLNVPEYQQKNGHQYISHIRTQTGVKWRVSRLSSLDFYYRFQYGYNRDINITRKNGYIQLDEENHYTHSIGVTYNFDW